MFNLKGCFLGTSLELCSCNIAVAKARPTLRQVYYPVDSAPVEGIVTIYDAHIHPVSCTAGSAIRAVQWRWAWDQQQRWIYSRTTGHSGSLWYAIVEHGRDYNWFGRAWGSDAPGAYITLNNATAEQAKQAVQNYFHKERNRPTRAAKHEVKT